MSKKVENASILDLFMSKAKGAKKNPSEDSDVDQQPAKNFDDVEETDQSDMESMEAREKEGSEIENDLNQSSSTDLVSVHASNEVIVIHSCERPSRGQAPFRWSVKQQDYFTCTYPGIIGLNGKIGCRECREVNTLKLHATCSKVLKKKIVNHANSDAHLTTSNILKERQ